MQISGGKVSTSGYKKIVTSLWYGLGVIFFTTTSLELKLNRETVPLTEANSQHTDVDVLLAFSS